MNDDATVPDRDTKWKVLDYWLGDVFPDRTFETREDAQRFADAMSGAAMTTYVVTVGDK